MAVGHALISVTATATNLLTLSDKHDFAARSVLVQNGSAVPVYVGGPDVTPASYGYLLAPGREIGLDLGEDDVPYACTDSEAADIAVLHTGL